MVRHAKLQKSDIMFILGESSCVGTFAVQFVHAMGVCVVATTSSRNVELVTSPKSLTTPKTKMGRCFIAALHRCCDMEPSVWNDDAQLILKKIRVVLSRFFRWQSPKKESEFGAQLVGEVYNTDPSAEKFDTITKYIENGNVKPLSTRVYPFEKVLDANAKLNTYRTSWNALL
ncbi:hypothetical protein F442_07163 [Phytophthora nicotianae P10297]|uniref:Alcohol dehydrogenase-like C-terminal domain-containing protein n=3 Tax=Phytophthora nicotianae TaxID=4792 RepID=V9FDT8_PHYNI|nr:hypothetical protein F443_07100 [Phytophthora nicotianae P1569]ETO77665.1 hypothetical protein F444_07165 [Phytophthora nicotianae P1976]ETP46614.1 hypothetical protein F442_07163 [Phytophthora nicotianae P10297]